MSDDDLVYLLRRAAEERRLATDAATDEARAAHRGLADAYDERVRDVEQVRSSPA